MGILLTEDEFFVGTIYQHTNAQPNRNGDTVKWSFQFDGKWIVLRTSQLLKQGSFRHQVELSTGKRPPYRARQNYNRWLNQQLENCIIQENAGPV